MDLGNFINDVFSLEKEIARGQYDNLVPVLQKEKGITLEEAVEVARDIILALAHRLLELRAELTHVCTHLDLTETEAETTLRYADALEMWLGGYEPWHRNSLRYSQAMTQRPVSGPWAHEDLLGNAAQLRTRVTRAAVVVHARTRGN